MDANGKNPTTRELLTRAWNAVEGSRDWLKEFNHQQDAVAERQNKWDRDHPGWKIHHEISLVTRFPH